MKDFYIKELHLKDFKGQTRVFTPNEVKTIVKGCNGVGKTTLYKAFCWLITGYTDAINGKNHELYDNKVEITKDTPEAIVRAKVVIDDCEYELERRARAKFSRKRGSSEYVKDSSDSYVILVDNIETSVSDFNAFCERMFGTIDLLPYMLIGERFANLAIDDKNKARKILEQITGEVSIDKMRGDYSMIKKDLQKYPIEQLKERCKNQLKPLKQRIVEVEALIETKEHEHTLYKVEEFNELSTRIEDISKKISSIDESILGLSKSVEPLLRKRDSLNQEIHNLMVELGDKRIAYNQKQAEETINIQTRIKEVDSINEERKRMNKKIQDEHDYVCAEYDSLSLQVEGMNKDIETLRQKRDTIKARVFNGEKCAYCGQELPFDELEKAQKKFNDEKTKELNSVIEQGKWLKDKINKATERLLALKEKKHEMIIFHPYEDKKALEQELLDIVSKQIVYSETDEFKAYEKKIEELGDSIPNINIDNKELLQEKNVLMEELQKLNREYGMKAYYDSLNNEISELRDEQHAIGCQIATIEGCLDKIKEYEEEKANIISDEINKKLTNCKVVMYSRQKDGELKPDCVIIDTRGVKYATLNNSARIKVCLEIQRMFCMHFGINMPVFVDESAIFDSKNLPKFNSQTIYLLASDDKNLNVE